MKTWRQLTLSKLLVIFGIWFLAVWPASAAIHFLTGAEFLQLVYLGKVIGCYALILLALARYTLKAWEPRG